MADVRLLADAMHRNTGSLDERTIDDLELATLFAAIDRTRTITGAQVLWRWLVTPTHDVDVLATREAAIAAVGDIGERLGTSTAGEAPDLPRLLWGAPVQPVSGRVIAASLCALVTCLVLAHWWPVAILGVLLLFAGNIVLDDWSKLRLAHASRAVERLDDVLGRAAALARHLPALATPIAGDLALRSRISRRVAMLRVRDPFDALELLRAGLLVRLTLTRSCLRIVDAERDRLRRIVLWFGEIDALASIGTLRSERTTHVPELVPGPPMLVARDLVHPGIPNAVGNDVELAASGLLITGSNMSGKSTLLRTIAVNAILAQSFHTTFGAWRASPLHVRAVMRIADDPERGMSTYAVEVAAMRELVADDRPCLFAIDEPFNGTNPAVRVPIVVAVLEYLVGRGLVVAATHDLDVATRLNQQFARAYFEERDGTFDRRLRAGIAPATNAVEILLRAHYPAEITNRLVAAPAP
ncbi:MAG: hypothetical protein AB7P03_22115 [Kofleriaceae bacterium]